MEVVVEASGADVGTLSPLPQAVRRRWRAKAQQEEAAAGSMTARSASSESMTTSALSARSCCSLEDIQTRLDSARRKREEFHQWMASKARVREVLVSDKAAVEKRMRDKLDRLQERLDNAERNRQLLMEEEKSRLTRSHALVIERYGKLQERAERDREALERTLNQKVAAAEAKRQELLAQERARAAALVSRAVAVARAQRERCIREQLGRRAALEAALKNARCRRSERLRSRPCQRLQRCWRQFQANGRTTASLMTDFVARGLDSESIQSVEFEVLAQKIQSPVSLRATRMLLSRLEDKLALGGHADPHRTQATEKLLQRMTPKKRGVKGAVTPTPRFPPRIFLSAYIMVGHPEYVLSTQGERELALLASARKLLHTFEELVRYHMNNASAGSTPPPSPCSSPAPNSRSRPFTTLLVAFDEAWVEYLDQFVAWKSHDAASLESELIGMAHVMELSMLDRSNSDRAQLRNTDMQAIREQVQRDQVLLRERISKLSGASGLARLEAALMAAREAHAARQAEELASTVDDEDSNQAMSDSPPPEAQDLKPPSPQPGVHKAQIAYELLHNPELLHANAAEGAQPAPSELQQRLKAAMERAFWDSVAQSVDNKNYDRVVSLVDELRTELSSLVPSSERQQLQEHLDTELMKQMLQSNQLNMLNLLNYVFSIYLRLCAPAKDIELKAAYKELIEKLHATSEPDPDDNSVSGQVVAQGLRFLMEQLQQLKVDVSRARLRALAPVVNSAAGVDYIRKWFSREVAPAGNVDELRVKLVRTESWLATALQSLPRVQDELSPHVASVSTSRPAVPAVMSAGRKATSVASTSAPTADAPELHAIVSSANDWKSPAAVVRVGIMQLLARTTPVQPETLTETLQLDAARLHRLQNNVQRLVVTATAGLLLQQTLAAKSVSRTVIDSAYAEYKTSVRVLLDKEGTRLQDLAAAAQIVASDVLSEDKAAGTAQLLGALITKTISEGNQVFQSVFANIVGAVRSYLLLGSASGKAAAITSLQRCGAVGLADEVFAYAAEANRVAGVNVQVFAPWYSQLIQSLA
eukprot:jgi/Chlat1/3595/Chrsp234S03602